MEKRMFLEWKKSIKKLKYGIEILWWLQVGLQVLADFYFGLVAFALAQFGRIECNEELEAIDCIRFIRYQRMGEVGAAQLHVADLHCFTHEAL